MATNGIIYLDYHATTPCDPAVVEAMLPYFGALCANPASSVHEAGRTAAYAIETARTKVASLINAETNEIVFTSGTTESNNIAISGVARGYGGPRRRIVTSAVEHKAVLAPCKILAAKGFEVVILPVDTDGTVLLAEAERAINEDTLLVSIQAANNEVGTIQPVPQIAAIAQEHGAIVHCDAAQAIGKIPFDVNKWQVDLVSFSAHKFYGPQGVGALYIRRGSPTFGFKPLAVGGGQEMGLRPGTLNVPGIVGMGKACELCKVIMPEEEIAVRAMRDRMENNLLQQIPGLRRNGSVTHRLPGNCNLTVPGLDTDIMLARLPYIAMSTGSACSSGAIEPSSVLLAMGRTCEEAYSTIRIGLGRFTTHAQIDIATKAIAETWAHIVRD